MCGDVGKFGGCEAMSLQWRVFSNACAVVGAVMCVQ